jgi:putative salt-induced outer membrane protein YdiY
MVRVRIVITVLTLLSLHYGYTEAQVNTEEMRKIDLDEGLSSSVKLDFGIISGNSDLLKLKTGFRSDYISGKYYFFGVVEYNRGLQDDEVFINKGFVHVRGIRELNQILHGELFMQREFNDFIKLKRRSLAGGGLRFTVLPQSNHEGNSNPLVLNLGMGIMREYEEIDISPPIKTSIFRSTNYISLKWRLDERTYLGAVTYYQVYLRGFSDYRVLVESVFGFDITRSVTFQLTFDLRYDHDPPTGVKNHDLEVNNGITFAF